MSTELVPQDITGGPLAKEGEFDNIVTGGDYLPRLSLCSAKSDACAEGKIAINHYGLMKDDAIVDLGLEVDLVFISWRSKAVQSGDDFIICYTPDFDAGGVVTNPLFKKIMAQAGVRDSGAMYGPEFLVYVPAANTFATLHMNSKTSRREAKNIKPLLGKAATLKSKLIDPPNSKFKWQGIVTIPCSSPLEVPDEAVIRDEWTKFQNPPENEVEVATDDDRAR
ncbi:unnamed protein product [marine sediment metagenome]|uniref:Uncharacterized protein n=1 Tax=marine sediment metagenome TaxID=412755 RepID=X0RWL2_9ZZZZ